MRLKKLTEQLYTIDDIVKLFGIPHYRAKEVYKELFKRHGFSDVPTGYSVLSTPLEIYQALRSIKQFQK